MTAPSDLLEVGRVGRAHGLHGEVAVTFTTQRDERHAPGAVLYADEPSPRRRDGAPPPRTLAHPLRRRHRPRRRPRAPRRPAARRAPRPRRRRALGPRARRRRGRRHHRPRARPVVAVEANPAHDSSSSTRRARPGRVHRRAHPGPGRGRPARRAARGLSRARRRVHHLPRVPRGPARRVAARQGPPRRHRRRPRPRPPRVHRRPAPQRRRHPFGGGAGMVMRPEPLFDAVEAVDPPRPLLLLSPGGRRFDHAVAAELAAGPGFSLISGRYEGVDQRVADHLCDGELSVGDYVLAGGEAGGPRRDRGRHPADPRRPRQRRLQHPRVLRRRPLEEPQYTRPAEYRGWAVPAVLRSGDHAEIARWRHLEARRRTLPATPRPAGPEDLGPEEPGRPGGDRGGTPGTMAGPPPGAAP